MSKEFRQHQPDQGEMIIRQNKNKTTKSKVIDVSKEGPKVTEDPIKSQADAVNIVTELNQLAKARKGLNPRAKRHHKH